MRIWINQSFSLRNAVARIVAARPGIDLCVSAVSAASPVRSVAPTFWAEPARGLPGYPEWVLDAARARGVDAVVPQRDRRGIARLAEGFAAAGIALHAAATPEILDLLDDKAAFAADLAGDPMLCPTIRVTTAADCAAAIAHLSAATGIASVKPSRGIYGAGYWTLDPADPFSHLRDPDARRIAPAAFLAAMRAAEEAGRSFDLIVMEHLPGIEVSVDIVADRGATVLAAVRTKIDQTRQRIQTRHSLIAHAAALTTRYGLHGAVNIQYKQDVRGDWRLLEINSRIAGGASYCDAIGIPFCPTWMDVVAGRGRPYTEDIDAEVDVIATAVPVSPD